MKFKIQKIKAESSKWLLISATVLGIGLTSCEKEENLIEAKNNSITSLDAKNAQGEKIYDSQSENQRIFGKALLEAMKNSPALRKFIKTEALKKFNHDYDVLFATVKNEIVEGNKTFRDIILENVESEEILKQIEFTNPLLTIFVPSLPENSFSAQTWDTENEIPDVALRLHTTNDVPCFGLEKGEYVIEAPYIPSYPIVVVKQNERITSSLTKGYELCHVKQPFNVVDGVEYKFMDSNFDNRKILTRSGIFIGSGNPLQPNPNPHHVIQPEVVDAYNTYRNVSGWHRDEVYYGVTPSNPNGQFSYDFKEKLTYIRLNEVNGSGMNSLNHISDQSGNSSLDDPSLYYIGGGVQSSFWSDGDFEFNVFVLVTSINQSGFVIPKSFPVAPEDLFDVKFTYNASSQSFIVSDVKTKPYYPFLEIMNWNLEQYSTTVFVSMEEMDRTEIVDRTITRYSEFAANFGIDVDGILKKIGLEFGLSTKTSTTVSTSVNYTLGADDLSGVEVNFADDIITQVRSIPRYGTSYEVRKYNTGYITICLEPIRVQNY